MLKWESVYNDGTVHNEEELKTSEKIDRTKLKEFRLFKDNKILFQSFFKNPNRKLIFRRRVILDGFSGQYRDTVYLVGWHENIKGVSVKSICYIYSDGHIEFDDARNNLELVPCEM